MLFAVGVVVAAQFVGRTTAVLHRRGDTAGGLQRAVLLALLVVVPTVVDTRTLDQFNLPKLTAAVVGAVILAAVWIVGALTPGSCPRWRNGLHWPVLALLAWTVVTTATSVSPRFSVLGATGTNDGLLAVVVLAIAFFAVAQAVTMDQVKAVLSVLYFGAGGLSVLYGLIQLHDRVLPGGRWDWLRPSDGGGTESFFDGAVFSTLGNPNHLGAFLAMLLPIGLVLFLLHRSPWARCLIVAVMAGMVVELLQTASRGALIASVVALGILGALLWPDLRRHRRIFMPMVGLVAAAVVVAAVALAATPEFSTKLSSDLGSSATLTQRFDLWSAGVAMANDRPLLGWGPDTFQDHLARYQAPDVIRRQGNRASVDWPHNLFIAQVAACGYPGLILLLALLGFAAVRAVGTLRLLGKPDGQSDGEGHGASPGHEARLCLVAVVAGLGAYLVQACFNVTQLPLSFVFWVLLGLLSVISVGAGFPTSLRGGASLRKPAIQVGGRARARRRGHHDAADPDVARGAVAVLMAAGLLMAIPAATRPLRADHKAWAARVDLAAAAELPPDEAARLARRGAARRADAINLNPWEASYLVAEADAFLARTRSLADGSALQRTALERARRDLSRAVGLRPYNSVFLSLYADILLKIDQVNPSDGRARAEAIRALRRAVKANPHSAALRERLELVVAR
jgi:hypothetical protein